jgi:hypothetical protein
MREMTATGPSATPGALRGRASLAALLVLSLGTAFTACSSTAPQTGGGTVCTYAQEIECFGPGACAGTRICLPDLSGYGACVCLGGDAGDAGHAGDASDAGSKADR